MATTTRWLAAFLFCLTTCAHACAQEKKPIDPREKRFVLNFKNAPWKDVFVWLADQSGMPYASPYKAPPGTFTYASPKGKMMSLVEAIDTINDALTQQNHVLAPRDVTITMFPLDAEVREFMFRQVRLDSLDEWPRHVPVRTIVTVKEDAEKVAQAIKHQLPPFTHVTPLTETDQLILRGTPNGIRAIFQLIELQASHSLKYVFVPVNPPKKCIQVFPNDSYSDERRHGFDLNSHVTLVHRRGDDPLRTSFVTSDKPFFFSVLLPEGNYNVTITFGDTDAVTETTVLAESRRLMLPSVKTKAGEFATRTITVNIRNANLQGGGRVKLKDREINGPVSSPVLHWDDKLTLEFAGKRPCVNMIEIARNDAAITVFLAADSTVTDQTKGDYRGWGQMLPSFFKPGMVAIANHAESGEATTSFIGAKRLDKILQSMKKGNYLFIQFGHNDQNQKRSIDDYTKALKRYVAETRKREAIPVLVTPIARRNFGPEGKIRNNLGDYPDAVRRLAKEEKVALIDLNALSKEYYESLGPEKSKSAFVAKDNTHTNEVGALELAHRVAQAIKKSDLGLAKYLAEQP